MKKKHSKKVECGIIESEVLIKKRNRKEAFMRLPKDKRLKTICSQYIGLAVDYAKMLGKEIGAGGLRETTGILTKDLKKGLRSRLTKELRKAEILPLST